LTVNDLKNTRAPRRNAMTERSCLTKDSGASGRGNHSCTAIAKTGKPCQLRRWRDSKFCYLHTGNNASLLGMKGGKRRARFSFEQLIDIPAPKTAGDLRDLIGHTIRELRKGHVEPKVANPVAYLAGAMADALELVEYETRLKRLEAPEAEWSSPSLVTSALPTNGEPN
jgi:hypothetical protein